MLSGRIFAFTVDWVMSGKYLSELLTRSSTFSTYVVVVKVEKYCIRRQTPGKTVKPTTAADHVHFVPNVLHVKVNGFFSDLAVTVVGTSADCFL